MSPVLRKNSIRRQAASGSTPNEFVYRGEQFDTTFGMYYLRARYYEPGIGRFLTADKVESEGERPACDCPISTQKSVRNSNHHVFAYAAADPVNRIDPTGTTDLIENALLDCKKCLSDY